MPRREDINNSILIVSSSQQFNVAVKKSLVGFITIDMKKNAASARRCILEKSYDLVVVDAPLLDESGEEFVIDVAERSNSMVLITAPREVYHDISARVTDMGIMVIPKPVEPRLLDRAIRYLTAVRNRMHKLEKKNLTVQDKMEEIRLVSQAKLLLLEKRKMSEEDAHKLIGREAMNNGVSRKKIAEIIIRELG